MLSSTTNYSCGSLTPPSKTNEIVGGSVGGSLGLVLIIVIIAVVYIRRKRAEMLNRPFDFTKMVQSNTADLMLQSDRSVPREVKRSTVKITQVLGEGNFGEVSKAILTETAGLPGYIVAVKVLKENVDATSAREQFLSEASLMAQFSHDNVTRLIGVVTIGEPMLVILEYCENGSLDVYLEKYDTVFPMLMKFSVDCAGGMAYLASLGFIHRDLAARNVLLGSDMTAKIADFGMSRVSVDKNYYVAKSGQLPVRWTAPEALEHQRFSEKSDVWSFGILMYEIFTQGTLPYLGWNNSKVWVQVMSGYRLSRPMTCPQDVYDVMKSCWGDAAAGRPTFGALLASLTTIASKTDDLNIVQPSNPKIDASAAAYISANAQIDPRVPKTLKKFTRSIATQTLASAPVYPDVDLAAVFSIAHQESVQIEGGTFPNSKHTKSSLVYLSPDADIDALNAVEVPKQRAKSSLIYEIPDIEDEYIDLGHDNAGSTSQMLYLQPAGNESDSQDPISGNSFEV